MDTHGKKKAKPADHTWGFATRKSDKADVRFRIRDTNLIEVRGLDEKKSKEYTWRGFIENYDCVEPSEPMRPRRKK